jgi:hypothetical protein
MNAHSTIAIALERSAQSRAFEAFWRSLRNDELVPSRASFNPAKASQFLRDLVLLECPSGNPADLRIRLAGDGFQQLTSSNLTGQSFIPLMSAAVRDAAVLTTHLLFETPCGLWQITPAHLALGYAIELEITAFPLSGATNGVPYLLCLVRRIDGILEAKFPIGNPGLALDTALQYRFLDIGAGEPEWNPPPITSGLTPFD